MPTIRRVQVLHRSSQVTYFTLRPRFHSSLDCYLAFPSLLKYRACKEIRIIFPYLLSRYLSVFANLPSAVICTLVLLSKQYKSFSCTSFHSLPSLSPDGSAFRICTGFRLFFALWLLFYYRVFTPPCAGIIAFRTLLSLIPFAASLRLFADPCRLTSICASVYPQLFLFESLKHFLFRSFFLYFYYSTNFSFVKCFLKIFSKKLKKFFKRS